MKYVTDKGTYNLTFVVCIHNGFDPHYEEIHLCKTNGIQKYQIITSVLQTILYLVRSFVDTHCILFLLLFPEHSRNPLRFTDKDHDNCG